ncbi:MAG: complex I subunit 1 family protein [Candidatus Bathyarchaeia archaeon]
MVSTETLIKIIELLIFPGFLFLIFYSLFCEWIDRKFFARLQNRFGPLHTGYSGVLQPLADLIKLLSKEDITPSAADKLIMYTTPIILFSIPLTMIFMVPILGSEAYINFEGDVVVMIFFFTILVIAVFMAGWSTFNRFSVLGGMRAALQMLSYEIPLSLAAIGPSILAKSISLSGIVKWQEESVLSFIKRPDPYSLVLGIATAFVMIVGFAILTLCMLAELEKVPFDIPEAETEIVSGWQAEFSGRKLALIRLGNNIKLVAASALMTTLFLGGPLGPGPVPAPVWFILKTILCVVILSNLRALFARFRIDQVFQWAWRNLIPISILYIVAIEMLAWVM